MSASQGTALSNPTVAAEIPQAGAGTIPTLSVLDHGFVSLVDQLGSDLTVVNAARVSFGKRIEQMTEKDSKLVRYLAQHEHWSPFRHVQLQFHCKVPEFVARQWYKHVVGIAYSEAATVDHAWNEISLRYVNAADFDIYVPDGFRQQSADNKQASMDALVPDADGRLMEAYRTHSQAALQLYQELVTAGVAKEQARGVLPLNIYTEFYWTVSLQALVNFIRLRKHPGAQFEIREYAHALEQLTQAAVPISYQALLAPQANAAI
ncbi:MAG: FAD-dependent thymidylate synthase [Candidatus Melainabacteria bacterium]|nr:FAD-dependent thymidylate synthase [Candidatus Melainabacteria bacterium]